MSFNDDAFLRFSVEGIGLVSMSTWRRGESHIALSKFADTGDPLLKKKVLLEILNIYNQVRIDI